MAEILEKSQGVATPHIQRRASQATVTIATGEALSSPVNFAPFAGGMVLMPAAWTAAAIGFYVADDQYPALWYPVYSDAGALVEITSAAANLAMKIPDEVFAAHWLRVWSQTSGSGVNQAATRTLTLLFKG